MPQLLIQAPVSPGKGPRGDVRAVGTRNRRHRRLGNRSALGQPGLGQVPLMQADLPGNRGLVAHQPLMDDTVIQANAVGNGAGMDAPSAGRAKGAVAQMRHGRENPVR